MCDFSNSKYQHFLVSSSFRGFSLFVFVFQAAGSSTVEDNTSFLSLDVPTTDTRDENSIVGCDTSDDGASKMFDDEPCFTGPCVTFEDKACQFPETVQSRQGYECLGDRRKRELRAEIMSKIDRLMEDYTSLGEKGTCQIMGDIISSKTFQHKFASVLPQASNSGNDDRLLKALAKDYLTAKDKQESKLIRAQGAKVTGKLLIGDSFKGSKLRVDGSVHGNSRIEAAKAVGRVNKCGDERRRLLSIVAQDFSQSELQSYFRCSKSTITAARVHALLFGRGGAPHDGLTFTRQAVSPEIVHEFEDFIQQDNISRPSSCRSVLVDGKETGVRYWQCDVKDVIQQYQLKFPNGLKRTYIYTHLPKNFRMNSMLAGLCNLCDDFGHSNFDSLLVLLDDLNREGILDSPHSRLVQSSREHQKFLKLQFSKEVSNVLSSDPCGHHMCFS